MRERREGGLDQEGEMERLTVAEKGVGRGGGEGWGSCGEGPLLIPTYCLRTWSPTPNKPRDFAEGWGGGKRMERPGRYLRNQKPKEEEEGGSHFHFSLDFPSPASRFAGWP